MYGYHIFLGRGDWGTSRDKSWDPTFRGNVPTRLLGDWGLHRQGANVDDASEWTTSWTLGDWKEHIDFLVDKLGVDTLNFCMNGYELPYPSKAFPEAVELDHQNVENEFFQQVLDYARGRHITVNALFCTMGHAWGYAAAHPEYTTVSLTGERHRENLCHNHPEGRRYAETVIKEVLGRYSGFDGLCFHPPENSVPCHCEFCRNVYEADTGRGFDEASEEELGDFYWKSCLAFQRDMEKLGRSLIPDAQLYSITIPGSFEEHFDIVGREIPRSTILMHWDYWSFDERIPELLDSLDIYRSRGHRVIFIPSSGWSLDKCGDHYGEAVLSQIDAVKKHGIDDIIYFLGAIWNEETLVATSWKLNRAK